MSDKPTVGVSLHGPGASIETAIEAGEAMKRLLAAVGKEMGIPDGAVEWEVDAVQFQCDGCGLKRADRPGPDEGWAYRDGDDLCPTCATTAERSSPEVSPSEVGPSDG